MGKEFDVDKLTGSDNYHTWSFAIKNYIQYKGYGNCIEYETDDKGVKKINSAGAYVIAEKDATKLLGCKAMLVLSVEKKIFLHIQNCNSAMEIWNVLRNKYEDKGLSRKIKILKTMINSKSEDADDMQSYIDIILDGANKLQGIGFKIADELIAAILLAGLSDHYQPLIMALEATHDDLKSDLIVTKLLEVKPAADSKGKSFFGKKNNKSRKNDKKIDKDKRKCFNCGRTNHLIKDCRAPKKNSGDNDGNGSKANAAFSAFSSQMSSNKSSRDWFMDSGGSRHMTHESDILVNKRPANVDDITCANNDTLKVKSSGDTILKLADSEIPMSDVLHVPDLGVNLLSVSQIVSKGNTVFFDKSGCTVKNGAGDIILKTKCENGVYKISEKRAETCMMATSSYVWHRRLGHLNLKSLKSMRDGAVGGITFKDDGSEISNCEVCSAGKMARLPFPTSSSRASKILEIIHSDLDGPMETNSIGHAKYFLTFIDDFSRKVFVYFLKQKSEVLDRFKEFKRLVENQTGRRIEKIVDGITKDGDQLTKNTIKKLRTDNGGEFLSTEFIEYCKSNGIQHQLTNAYTPQQNGVAERMNRTIVEKAKCLLFDAKLPKTYWAEAVNMATFIINKSVNSLGRITPDELYYGEKPDLTNLKIFGTEIMVHIPKEKRRKWDKKAEKLIFVGYADDTKGYRCMDPKTRKLTISRDVKFLEELQKPEKVILKMGTDDKKIEIRDSEKVIEIEKDIDKHQRQGETVLTNDEVIVLDDTILDETLDDSDDPDYEPSNESKLEAENDENDVVPKRKKKKVNPRVLSLTSFAFFVEPKDYKEATTNDDKAKWSIAMNEEIESHHFNGTWTLTKLPEGRKAIKSKWVYKLKRNEIGNVIRFKARLVAKGCSQRYGLDYNETFSPVVRYASIRFLFALAVKKNWKCYQLDAITAYLHGEVSEEIYMEQPEGYNDGSQRVCKLNKAIYGLKQAGRLWNEKLEKALFSFGLKKSKTDPCIYFKEDMRLLIAIYVDDFLIFYVEKDDLSKIHSFLNENFRMKDVGPISHCLGMRIVMKDGHVSMDQERYTRDILKRFEMLDCKPVGTPSDTHSKLSVKDVTPENSLVGQIPYQEAVGSLLYLAQGTRPDIAFAVNNVSRFNNSHTQIHWTAVKRIFRYIKGTINFKLCFSRDGSGNMDCYSDSDWASDPDKRRSCTGHLIRMSNGAITWASKRQSTVALSSTEAEYMAISSALCDVIWVKQMGDELDSDFQRNIPLYCDNQSTLKLATSDAFRPRTKHIDIRYHHIREKVHSGLLNLKFVGTEENIADALTKAVTKEKHEYCAKGMGLF